MKLRLQAVARSLWRVLLVSCFFTILLVLTAIWNRYVVEPDLERIKNTCVVLAALSFVALSAAWCRRQARNAPDGLWVSALLVTTFVGVIGLTYLSFVLLVPSPVEELARYRWPYLDRRWIWTLYLLALILIYTPGFARRVIARFVTVDAEHSPARMARSSTATRLAASGIIGLLSVLVVAASQVRLLLSIELYLLCAFLAYVPFGLKRSVRVLSFDRLIAAYLIGLALAVIFIAPGAPSVVGVPIDAHEMGHLGSLQAISQGATPYVKARTQYGPGHQLVTYYLMRNIGFTIAGFRLSQLILNILGIAILFGTAFFAFGWGVGAVVTIAALFLSPYLFWAWSGWGFILRWIPPYLVGAILPHTLTNDDAWERRWTTIAMLGVACGLLLWFSQDTVAATILAALLILAGAVVRGNMRMAAACSAFAAFALSGVSVFLFVVTRTVGSQNLGLFFGDYFRGSLLLQGLQNQAWGEPFRPWGIVFYLTPYILLLIMIVVLYSRMEAATATE